jgi:hypothetical protein
MCGDVRSTEDCVDKSGGNALGRKEIDMVNTKTLEKHIVGENGIGYTLGEDGLYYPDLKLPEGTHYVIGRYGRMRGEYLKTYRRGDYIRLLLDGKLNEYLHDVDEECHREVELAVKRMLEKEGVTEQLKAENSLEWVRRVSAVKNVAEEMVFNEVVYV